MTSKLSDHVFDVAVVGLGPVGAVLANLLGREGLDIVVVERDADIVPAPRAVALDGEIMRVIQAIGLADDLEPRLRPSPGAQYLDQEGRLLLKRPSAQEPGPQGWCAFYTFHQPELEALLRKGLARYPNVDVRLRHEAWGVEVEGDDVRLMCLDLAKDAPSMVRARFVVGCDGARSLVRASIGSVMEDLGLHEPWVVADFRVTGPADLPDLTTQYCDPDEPVTYVNVVENRRRFEFKLRADDDLSEAAAPPEIWRRVAPWLNPQNAELVRAAPYTFHSLIAKQWRLGRLLIAGDSAHQTPPFLGQGLCAGIRDASNLAWKLKAVLRDAAPQAILDTYGPERIPHAREFIAMAVGMAQVLTGSVAPSPAGSAADDAGAVLVYPTPRLGDGFFESDLGGGRIAPQPTLAGGRRLDDEIGDGFGLVVDRSQHRDLREHSGRMAAAALAPVPASGAVAAWLTSLGASFAILRPDRYLYAVGSGDAELSAVLSRLCERLGCS